LTSNFAIDVFEVISAIRSPTVASSGNVIVDAPPGPRSLARMMGFIVMLVRRTGMSPGKIDYKSCILLFERSNIICWFVVSA
jgi:hypothetical protein